MFFTLSVCQNGRQILTFTDVIWFYLKMKLIFAKLLIRKDNKIGKMVNWFEQSFVKYWKFLLFEFKVRYAESTFFS